MSTSNESIVLTNEQYSSLLTVISILNLNNACDNIIVIDGHLRQSNNNKNMLYDIDLTSILGTRSFILTNLNQKKDLLEVFRKQKSTVSISWSERGYEFSDTYSKIFCIMPNLQLITKSNSVFTDLNKTIGYDTFKPIFSYNLSRLLIDRVFSFKRALSCKNIILEGHNNYANLKLCNTDTTETTTGTVTKIEGLNDFETSPTFNSDIIIPFVDDITLSLYNRTTSNDYIINAMSKIGVSPEIPISMWSLSIYSAKYST